MALPALINTGHPGSFGSYELIEQLGQGGMAVVFLARHRGHGGFVREVVLKAMLPNLVQHLPIVEMFEAEARLTAQLRHPNIVRVEDFGVADQIPYLIMEHLDGKNLSQLRNKLNKAKRAVPLGFAVRVARDLCLALGYAHHFVSATGERLQVIHRDVSPSNVMVQRDGGVKLLDFGVAKLSSAAGQAVTSSLKGKFAYMSPEQVNHDPIDRRCDVFAAGIVLHELLTGRRLFGTKSELETLRRVSAAEVAPPSLLNPAVTPAVDAIVMRALSRNPRDRFDSGVEMAQALDALGLAAGRRELADTIEELFPRRGPASAHEELAGLDGDTDPSVEAGIDEVTDAEGVAHSAPRLVVLSNDDAILSDESVSRSRPSTNRELVIVAEPSGSGWQATRAPDTEPVPVTVDAQRARKHPDSAPLDALPTVTAPLDEIRPTRVYSPAEPAVAKVRALDELEAKPTQAYKDPFAATVDAKRRPRDERGGAPAHGEMFDEPTTKAMRGESFDGPTTKAVRGASLDGASKPGARPPSARVIVDEAAGRLEEALTPKVAPRRLDMSAIIDRLQAEAAHGRAIDAANRTQPSSLPSGDAQQPYDPVRSSGSLPAAWRIQSTGRAWVHPLLAVVGLIGVGVITWLVVSATGAPARKVEVTVPRAIVAPAPAAPIAVVAPTNPPAAPVRAAAPTAAAPDDSLVGLGDRRIVRAGSTPSRSTASAPPAEARPARTRVASTRPPRHAAPRPASPGKVRSVKEGRIVDPFEGGE